MDLSIFQKCLYESGRLCPHQATGLSRNPTKLIEIGNYFVLLLIYFSSARSSLADFVQKLVSASLPPIYLFHFGQFSPNSKTNLFPNTNYFVFICNFIKFHNLIVVYIEPAKLSITVSLFLHCSDFVQKSQFEEGSLKFTICLC